jgi:aconitate hydratase
MPNSLDTFRTRTTVTLAGEPVEIFSLPALQKAGIGDISRLPFSLKVLLENLLRREDGAFVKADDIRALAGWVGGASAAEKEIAFMPARVLLQDFTGVPCVVGMAAKRAAMVALGGDPARVNPLLPVELIIDHSVQVDVFGRPDAFERNADLEYERNRERYAFLRWGQQAFQNFRVVPPETGIVHQVNLEYLARVVFRAEEGGRVLAYPDTVVGTDSHTTMVNGLGVVGWGVGGIEAEAAMLGQPISMLIPQVIGFRLDGRLSAGVTATDLVLTITQRLRKHGVVGKFVEFYGPGLAHLTLADRAMLSNMCPEYGATVAMFPIDAATIDYLTLTGRDPKQVRLVEEYAKVQGWFATADAPEAAYAERLTLDLAEVEPSLAGPKRPQDRVSLAGAAAGFAEALPKLLAERKSVPAAAAEGRADIDHGAVVIAAITSCTNTSNPGVLIGAGLLAKKAVEKGLTTRPWVKTSLAPGSKVVTEYLAKAGLLEPLERLGFHLVGYGCTTCIGNSGPLPDDVAAAIRSRGLVVASVLSGNRNFEGRVQALVRANYLASPPLVVAYALAGRMDGDLTREPLGRGPGGDVYLRDIWPSESEIQQVMANVVEAEMFRRVYAGVFEGDHRWKAVSAPSGSSYAWDPLSTYIQSPPFLAGIGLEPAPLADVIGARALAVLGDSVTTDHISPAGSIQPDSPAGKYLIARGVSPKEFNSYGARRGNHEVMMRGTFANIRLKNQLVPGVEGGYTRHLPDGEQMAIYDAAMRYRDEGVPLVVLAGKEYGCGSSRDWAAKGTALLGVRAVIAESFERIHRSNLVLLGVLPLQFAAGASIASLGLTGEEVFEIRGIAQGLAPRQHTTVRAVRSDGSHVEFQVVVRIDTPEDLTAFRHGGVLPAVVRGLAHRR